MCVLVCVHMCLCVCTCVSKVYRPYGLYLAFNNNTECEVWHEILHDHNF